MYTDRCSDVLLWNINQSVRLVTFGPSTFYVSVAWSKSSAPSGWVLPVKNRAGKLTVSICKQSMVNSKSSLLEVGQERQRLQEILMQNHRELLELSTTTTPDDKKAWGNRSAASAAWLSWSLGVWEAVVSEVLRSLEALCISMLGQTTTKSAVCGVGTIEMCCGVFIFSAPGPSGADCWDGRSSWWAEESPGCRSCRALSHQGLDENLGWRFGDLIWSRWDGEFVASKKLSPNANPKVNGMTTERFSWKKHVLTVTKCAVKSFQLLERFFFAGFGQDLTGIWVTDTIWK